MSGQAKAFDSVNRPRVALETLTRFPAVAESLLILVLIWRHVIDIDWVCMGGQAVNNVYVEWRRSIVVAPVDSC